MVYHIILQIIWHTSAVYSVSVETATVDDLCPIKYCLFNWGINSWDVDKHTSDVECDSYRCHAVGTQDPLVNWYQKMLLEVNPILSAKFFPPHSDNVNVSYWGSGGCMQYIKHKYIFNLNVAFIMYMCGEMDWNLKIHGHAPLWWRIGKNNLFWHFKIFDTKCLNANPPLRLNLYQIVLHSHLSCDMYCVSHVSPCSFYIDFCLFQPWWLHPVSAVIIYWTIFFCASYQMQWVAGSVVPYLLQLCNLKRDVHLVARVSSLQQWWIWPLMNIIMYMTVGLTDVHLLFITLLHFRIFLRM